MAITGYAGELHRNNVTIYYFRRSPRNIKKKIKIKIRNGYFMADIQLNQIGDGESVYYQA